MHILDLELKDTEKAHIMDADGVYVKPVIKGDDFEKINSQLIFGQEASRNSKSLGHQHSRVFIPEMKA